MAALDAASLIGALAVAAHRAAWVIAGCRATINSPSRDGKARPMLPAARLNNSNNRTARARQMRHSGASSAASVARRRWLRPTTGLP